MPSVKKRRVFDSFALLAYLKKEEQFEKVKNLLSEKDPQIFINDINIGEVYYILARERGRDAADFFSHVIFPSLPIRGVENSFQDVIEAAKIKAEFAISFADCFAAMTAKKEHAVLLTGDPDFRELENLIEIEWL
jgi:predicted nucleic acid-binding protein